MGEKKWKVTGSVKKGKAIKTEGRCGKKGKVTRSLKKENVVVGKIDAQEYKLEPRKREMLCWKDRRSGI